VSSDIFVFSFAKLFIMPIWLYIKHHHSGVLEIRFNVKYITHNSGRRSACGPAVIADKGIAYRVIGEGITDVSRGADYDKHIGKPKIWAGIVRPAVVVWRLGRQDAALEMKKMQTWTFAFFSTMQPLTTGKGLYLPL